MTPTDELKRQWRRAMQYLPLSLVRDMADALRDALAEVRRLEWERKHPIDGVKHKWCKVCTWEMGARVNYGDLRHNYTPADWKQSAEKELGE